MENDLIDVMIAKNQIAIDFDAIETQEEEEESTVLPKGLVSAQNFDWIENEVLFVGVKTAHMLGSVNLSSIDICGKSSLDWLMLASAGCESVIINDPEDEIVSALKSLNTDKKYIAVFYGDTPLVDRLLFFGIMDYFAKSGFNAMSLPRGYVFKRDFLSCIERFDSPCLNKFNEQAFTIVSSSKSISDVSKYLYNKIKAYHIKNGVVLFGDETIFIDGDVEIESGVIIYPNNIIKGQTVIAKGAILESGNIIDDSIISEDAFISDSFVQKSKVGRGVSVTSERVVNQSL